jgi:GxxExxY protein
MAELIFKQESYKIIGVCMDVHRTLGAGFIEAVYKDAIEIEFKKLGIPYVREKQFNVIYKEITLDRIFFVDFFVYDKINLEVKAKASLHEDHYRQTRNYCACSRTELGILVNFGESSLQHKRIIVSNTPPTDMTESPDPDPQNW